MKKSILIALLGVGTAVASYGQGVIIFGNYSSSSQLNGISYASGPAAGLYCGPEISAILLYGASTSTSISQLTAIGAPVAVGEGVASGPGPIGSYAGWFGGVARTIDASSPGTTYAFAIEATGTYLGVTYLGYSPIAYGATQAGGSVPPPAPNLPASLLNGSFTVSPVPEPTTLALAGLGGLALLLFRRKQS